MSVDLSSLQEAVTSHASVTRVVIAATRGSVPREPGASMLVWRDGQSGTIGGGALELAASDAARRQLNEGVPVQVSNHALGPGLGQCCGGSVTLVSEVWDQARLEAVGRSPLAVTRRVAGNVEEPFQFRAKRKAARGGGRAVSFSYKQGWLMEPVQQTSRALWIHGAGHVGRAIVSVLSPLPELEIIWTDTSAVRFPSNVPLGVTTLPAANPAQLVSHAPRHADHLILTYSHALDFNLCDALLRHSFASAGLIGSATKWARFRKRLGALGHGPDAIARITCPIGDPSLGKSPQQIAIGVAHALLQPARQTVQVPQSHQDFA